MILKAAIVSLDGMRRQTFRDRFQTLGLLPALIMVAIGFHVSSAGLFFTAANIAVLLHQVAVNLTLAAGMTFVILAGGIDLSVSSILAASVVSGLMISTIPGLSSLWPLASLATGLACGLANGLLISRLRLPPFILTLASMTVMLGLTRAATGDMTIDNADLPYAWLGSVMLLGVPALAIVAMIVIAVSWFVLTRTVFGMSVYAVGGNQAAADLSGIDVSRIRLLVYGLSGLSSGIGAIMVATKLHGANAMQLGQSSTLDAITAVINSDRCGFDLNFFKAVTEFCVSDNDDFTHEGDESDHRLFAVCGELLIGGLEIGIVAGRGESGHEEEALTSGRPPFVRR